MEGFRGLFSGLWLLWSKIWQLSLKVLMKMGFEGAVGLCAEVGWHSQPLHPGGSGGSTGWILLNGEVSGTEKCDTLLTCLFWGAEQCLPCHHSLKKGPHKWFVFCSNKMTKTLNSSLNCELSPAALCTQASLKCLC